MANLTISVSDEVLKSSRIRAPEDNTYVNAVLNECLEEYARAAQIRRRRAKGLESLMELAEKSRAGRRGNTWTRDELYED